MSSPVRATDGGRRRLIVSAPGYGGSERAARAVLSAHRRGIVTSTSVRATGALFERGCDWLRDAPRLGVGACLVAVGDDPPVLSAAEIPSLLDRRGRLRATWRQLVPMMGRIDPADLRREFAAQLERITERGIVVDHLDAAEGLQRWPVVGKVMVQLAQRHGVAAVRVPFPELHTPSGMVERRLAHTLERRCRSRGLSCAAAGAGADVGEHHDLPSIIRSLHRLAASGAGVAELTTGLAWDDGSASPTDELAALTSGTVAHAVSEYGFVLGTFADAVVDGRTGRASSAPDGPAAATG
jgi:predicted glycoside hydrolase/deacetylase ChbG (UPF0249 family)